MNKIKTTIFATLTGLAMVSSANAAYLDKKDEGIYAIYNVKANQTLNVGIRLKKFNKYWEVEATHNGGESWEKLDLASGKVAKFTNTSRKTLARLFADHSNKELAKRITSNDKVKTDCIDAQEYMFCRFQVPGENTGYGWRQKQDGKVQFFDLVKVQ